MSKFAPHLKASNTRASPTTVCQKCLGTGHFTYQCKNTRPYVSRPSRTQELENPRVLAKLKAEGKPSVEVPEEFKKGGTANRILEAKEKERAKANEEERPRKKARRSRSASSSSDSDSSSGSSSSSSDSDSDSDSSGSGSESHSDSSSSSRSGTRERRRRVPRRRGSSSR